MKTTSAPKVKRILMLWNEINNRTNVKYKSVTGMNTCLRNIQRQFKAAKDGYAYCKVKFSLEWEDGSVAEFRQEINAEGEYRINRTGVALHWDYKFGPGVTIQHYVWQALGLPEPSSVAA